MEALIWGEVSSDGADHGPSCAAFASLTLELAAQTTGLRSWVTGGTTYPWPLPAWADVRVDTNPASPQITSVVADAQAHGRWHPLGDGYIPQPGDWAVYDGHVAVVISYSGGVLDTIAADSLPGLTVNAHSSAAPLADQGIVGFVDNGNLQPATGDTSGQAVKTAPQSGSTAPANAKAAPAKAKASGRSRRRGPRPARRGRARGDGRHSRRWPRCGERRHGRAREGGSARRPRHRPAPRRARREYRAAAQVAHVRSGERKARACQAIPAGHAGTGRVPGRRPPVRPRSSTPRRGRGTSRRSSAWSRPAPSPPSSATAYPHR